MGGDPHARTDRVFDELLSATDQTDAERLLRGMHWLAIVIEEVGFGIDDLRKAVEERDD